MSAGTLANAGPGHPAAGARTRRPRRVGPAAAAAVLLAVLLSGPAPPPPRADPLPAPPDVIVQLFQWPWADVATECTRHLGPAGFAAVQVSPPQEHVVLPEKGFPWWQDYQPVSYRLTSRRGDRAGFAAMVRACHDAGVRVYADAVVNHMTAQAGGVGSGGTRFTRDRYPGLYTERDFHHCDPVRAGGPVGTDEILDWSNRFEVQNCALLGLADLATETEPVRARLAGYLNDLLALGVDGFRIDAAKHVPFDDLFDIVTRLDRRPFLYQEVLYRAGEQVWPTEYRGIGALVEARYGPDLSHILRRASLLLLADLGAPTEVEALDYEPGEAAVVYVDSHDTQRSGATLSYRDGPLHTLATVFMLAWPYGTPTVMSGYGFTGFDDGPPADAAGRTLPVRCTGGSPGGFVCEHRRPAVTGLLGFRRAVGDAPVRRWWAPDDQVGFARGDRGYLVLNRGETPVSRTVSTGLPAGRYCDVVHGAAVPGGCSGPLVRVDRTGRATLTVPARDAVALHRAARAG